MRSPTLNVSHFGGCASPSREPIHAPAPSRFQVIIAIAAVTLLSPQAHLRGPKPLDGFVKQGGAGRFRLRKTPRPIMTSA